MASPKEYLEQVQSHLPVHLHDYLHVDNFGVLFQHPFRNVRLFESQPDESGVATVASSIFEKQGLFEEYCKSGKWESALFIVERPYRAEYLADLIQKHGSERLITAVGHVWSDAGYTSSGDDFNLWQDIWNQVSWTKVGKARKRRYHVMDVEDRKTLQALPETLSIYRGFGVAQGEYGYSWTLNRAKAEWFAMRNQSDESGPFVASLEVSKNLILAYFNGRKKEEVVIDPESIYWDNLQIETLPATSAQAG